MSVNIDTTFQSCNNTTLTLNGTFQLANSGSGNLNWNTPYITNDYIPAPLAVIPAQSYTTLGTYTPQYRSVMRWQADGFPSIKKMMDQLGILADKDGYVSLEDILCKMVDLINEKAEPEPVKEATGYYVIRRGPIAEPFYLQDDEGAGVIHWSRNLTNAMMFNDVEGCQDHITEMMVLGLDEFREAWVGFQKFPKVTPQVHTTEIKGNSHE